MSLPTQTEINFLKNYLSTLFFIFLAYLIYTRSNFHFDFISGNVSIDFLNINLEILNVFYAIIGLYVVFLIPLYLKYPAESKARIVIGYFSKVIRGDNSYSEKEKTALLVWIVKLFFAPLMITWLTKHIFSLVNNWHGLLWNTWLLSGDFRIFFDTHFFWTAFSTILFIDVLFFTLGYLIEMPALKNTIKSVEPTILWWAVTIICYPPLNSFMSNSIWWYSTDFPSFWATWAHVFMNIGILVLMWIYARASLALWFKASNLTNRGIVAKWPYKYVRHPAYICKNTAWFIGGMPALYIAMTSDQYNTISVLTGLLWWTFLYYLRAITEENHLSADPEYRAYKKQVKYKFIPGVW
jgi:protein-S-isoprenylcysteine O-methyltransferase Ste14